jgi:CcmD family protein
MRTTHPAGLGRGVSKLRRGARALVAAAALALTLGVPSSAWVQQPPSSTPDGFVPVENAPAKEQLPAAPLVIGAYAVAWIAVFGYLWSIWQRLGRVERDLADVRRRVETGARR